MSRSYHPDDLAAVQRIWRECGWITSDDEADQLESFLAGADVRVAEVSGEVECAVSAHRGDMSYDGEYLDLLVLSSVTTSWLGRKRGLANS